MRSNLWNKNRWSKKEQRPVVEIRLFFFFFCLLCLDESVLNVPNIVVVTRVPESGARASAVGIHKLKMLSNTEKSNNLGTGLFFSTPGDQRSSFLDLVTTLRSPPGTSACSWSTRAVFSLWLQLFHNLGSLREEVKGLQEPHQVQLLAEIKPG